MCWSPRKISQSEILATCVRPSIQSIIVSIPPRRGDPERSIDRTRSGGISPFSWDVSWVHGFFDKRERAVRLAFITYPDFTKLRAFRIDPGRLDGLSDARPSMGE
jgi:hypothetical protein